MKTLKIMGVHGLGDHRNSTWATEWEEVLTAVVPGQEKVAVEFYPVTYDPIFEDTEISPWEAAKAFWKLSRSAVTSPFRRERGVLGDLSNRIKWTAGYVVAWVSDKEFQQKTRSLMLDSVRAIEPDVILAHSLGSLITYNAFTHPDAMQEDVRKLLKRVRYVTLGSQIANPFVVKNLSSGRIVMPAVREWYHLYNRHDSVFTAPIRIHGETGFQQVNTDFDIDGMADHSAPEYLGHINTVESVWRNIAEDKISTRSFGPRISSRRKAVSEAGRSNRRALLVGINDYPAEADRLEGCVNDVYLMSSVLQERGFEPEDIRICVDSRATAAGIKSRMAWLLDDPRPGDERIFYYSGHGATIPEYGEQNEPDRLTETLVPWDFDWTPETAITDDHIFGLYSQLPYDLRLAMIFDCCHSGGIHRDGGARMRGLVPPDDIRHRSMRWDSVTKMWVDRDFKRINEHFTNEPKVKKAYFGESGCKIRLGRAGLVRGMAKSAYEKAAGKKKPKKQQEIVGPYLPLIIEACAEAEYSYEYRHGATSYGAFTYAVSQILRDNKGIRFRELVSKTADQLEELGYNQKPQILGPTNIVSAKVPWVS